MMRRSVRGFIVLLFLAIFAGAQTAVVTRNSNLRGDASTDNAPIDKLGPGAQLRLVEPDSTAGYFHVTTDVGTEGWIWARNVRLNQGPISTQHVGPAYLYPDPQKTTGLADTLSLDDLTRTYTKNCPAKKNDLYLFPGSSQRAVLGP